MAAASDNTVQIRITAETAGVSQAVDKVNDGLERLNAGVQDFGTDAKKAADQSTVALNQTAVAANQAAEAVDRAGMSAKQTAAAMRNVPAQFTDIVTSIASGQAPLTVLLQQGGQLKDMFGGAGNAARALGGYIAGLVNPFTVAAAAAAALGLAYKQGSEEADAFRNALILTGNAAGSSIAQLNGLAESVAKATGATQGAAADVLAQLANTGDVTAANLEKTATAAIAMERATGRAAQEIVKEFAELGKEPVKASEKLNEKYRYLTASVYEQIKALQDQGRTQEAATVAQNAYADAVSGRAVEITGNLGSIESGWLAIKDATKKAWDAVRDVGRGRDPVSQMQQALDEAQQDLNRGQTDAYGGREGAELAIRNLKAKIALEQQNTQATAASNAEEQRRIKLVQETAKWESTAASKKDQKAKELSDLKGLYDKKVELAKNSSAELLKVESEYNNKKAVIEEKYREKKTGPKGPDPAADLKQAIAAAQRYGAELEAAATKGAKLTQGEKALADATQKLSKAELAAVGPLLQRNIELEKAVTETEKKKKADEEAAKAAEKFADELAKQSIGWLDTAAKARDAIIDQNKKLEEEIALLGLSKDEQAQYKAEKDRAAAAAERVAAANLEEAASYLELIGGQDQAVRSYRALAEARRQTADAITAQSSLERQKGAKQTAVDEAESATKSWIKFSDDIERSLTDALMRSFESGDSFGKTFAENLKNTFKTMILKVAVQAIVSPVMGALQGVIGIGGGAVGVAGGAATAAGGIGNMASGANNLYGLFRGGSSAAGIYGSFATSGIGQSLGLSSTAAFVGPSVALAGTGAGLTAAELAAATGGVSGASLAAGGTAAAEVGLTGAGSTLGVALPWVGAAMALASALGIFSSGGGPKVRLTGEGSIVDGRFQAGSLTENFSDRTGNTKRVFIDDATQAIFSESLRATVAAITPSYSAQANLRSTQDPSGDSKNSNALRVGNAAGDIIFDVSKSTGRGAEDFQKWAAEQLPKAQIAILADAMRTANEDYRAIAESFVGTTTDMTAVLKDLDATAVTKLWQNISGMADIFRSIEENINPTVTGAAVVAITQLSGGIEKFSSNLGSYAQGYFSDEERLAKLREGVTASFQAMNVAMPETRAGFRALVESLDLSTEAGQNTFASLMGVATAFGTVADAAADAAAAAQRTALENTRTTVQGQIDGLISTYGDLAGAMAELNPPAKTLVEAWRDNKTALKALEDGLNQAFGNLPEPTALQALQSVLGTIAQFKNLNASIDEQIFQTRLDSAAPEEAVGLWKQREQDLWNQLATAGSADQPAIAQAITTATISRIKAEGRAAATEAAKANPDRERLHQTQMQALDDQISAAKNLAASVENIKDAVAGLDDFVSQLKFGNLSALNPQDQVKEAQALYQRTLERARSADPTVAADALSQLQSVAQSYLQEARGFYGGATSGYASTFGTVTGDLEGFDPSTLRAPDIQILEDQKKLLQDQFDRAGDLITAVGNTSTAEITALGSLQTTWQGLIAQKNTEVDALATEINGLIGPLRALVDNQQAEITQLGQTYTHLNTTLGNLNQALTDLANGQALTEASPKLYLPGWTGVVA